MKSEVMKTPRIEGEYRSPKAKVIEVKTQGVLCSSEDGNEPADDGGVIDLG